MTDSNLDISITQTIEQQWSALLPQNLSTSKAGSATLLTGKLSIPAIDDPINYTAIASHGVTDQSLNLVYLASVPGVQILSNGLYAFLLQATALMPPLEFIIDLQSDQLLVRQSQVVSRSYPIQSELFISATRQLIPQLLRCTHQISQQALETDDARQMADLLSESYLEVLAND